MDTWKQIAYHQGQKRMVKETLDEFKARVLSVWEKRKRAKYLGEWRKDSGE